MMQGFGDEQIKRQDFVDNQIFDLVNRLIPSEKVIEWDIGRNVPRPANSGIGGVPCPQAGRKGHNMNDHTLPGSTALWAESFK
ncbi:MAG: hypothetical protein KG012_19290 [Deltaproteobacteria bacterium]|nr:hypothetical protein [Deltaproteobacteria bacterium]